MTLSRLQRSELDPEKMYFGQQPWERDSLPLHQIQSQGLCSPSGDKLHRVPALQRPESNTHHKYNICLRSVCV